MTTIYLPRTDYIQRADDEGRDYHAYRTVKAAAERWAALDGNGWTVHGDEREEAPVVILSQNGVPTPNVWTVVEDPETELYPADALPFTIAALPAWSAGDYIARSEPKNAQVWQVKGRWRDDSGYEVVGVGSHADGRTGLIHDESAYLYVKVPAPTVTYTVTVRADHDADDVRDAIMGVLSGNVTVTKP